MDVNNELRAAAHQQVGRREKKVGIEEFFVSYVYFDKKVVY